MAGKRERNKLGISIKDGMAKQIVFPLHLSMEFLIDGWLLDVLEGEFQPDRLKWQLIGFMRDWIYAYAQTPQKEQGMVNKLGPYLGNDSQVGPLTRLMETSFLDVHARRLGLAPGLWRLLLDAFGFQPFGSTSITGLESQLRSKDGHTERG